MIFHLQLIFLPHSGRVPRVFLHRCFSFCSVSILCSTILHLCSFCVCGCLGTCIHPQDDLLHIQQTCMFSLYYPTWISSFYLHVWQPLPFLQRSSCTSSIMLSNFVAVEMTSHQNSPFPFESMPAWISMALAQPINIVTEKYP